MEDGNRKLIRPIEEAELAFLDKPDLITLNPERKAPLLKVLEHFSTFRFSSILREKPDGSSKFEPVDDNVFIKDDRKVSGLVEWLALVAGVMLFTMPMWMVFCVQSVEAKLGVISVLLTLFLATILVGLNITPVEALQSTAGYSLYRSRSVC